MVSKCDPRFYEKMRIWFGLSHGWRAGCAAHGIAHCRAQPELPAWPRCAPGCHGLGADPQGCAPAALRPVDVDRSVAICGAGCNANHCIFAELRKNAGVSIGHGAPLRAPLVQPASAVRTRGMFWLRQMPRACRASMTCAHIRPAIIFGYIALFAPDVCRRLRQHVLTLTPIGGALHDFFVSRRHVRAFCLIKGQSGRELGRRGWAACGALCH